MRSKILRIIGGALVVLIITALILLLFEGFSSVALFFSGLSGESRAPVAERRHTEYDRELGWINTRNVDIADMYGPGVGLSTNSQAVRSNRDIAERVKSGVVRAVCSGDSFTFGYGVSNDDTWCNLLMELDPRLETVNMGQGGYGVDQAYLWYKRDGGRFNPEINIFAFVTDDFKRMQKDNMFGYAKPLLKISSDGVLTVQNVPVPRRSFLAPFITRNIKSIEKLKFVELIRKFLPPKEEAVHNDEDTFMVALKLFEELKRINDERGAKLLTVYLPTGGDYRGNRANDSFRRELARQLKRRGINFLNLVDELRSLPPGKVKGMFIPKGAIDYHQAEGHFTRKGNVYVADLIYGELARLKFLPPPVQSGPSGER